MADGTCDCWKRDGKVVVRYMDCEIHGHPAPDSTPTEREAGCYCGVARGEPSPGCVYHQARADRPTEREADLCIADDNCGATAHLSACPERPSAAPTEREAGDVGEEVATVLWRFDGYERRPVDAVVNLYLARAAALAPLIAERERAAGARVLREAARAAATSPVTRAGDLHPGGVWAKWLNDLADALEGGD